jgi:hypothetical protein
MFAWGTVIFRMMLTMRLEDAIIAFVGVVATSGGLTACGRIGFAVESDAVESDAAHDSGATANGLADLVQQGISLTAAGATVQATYLGSQHAGDLDVVIIGWKDATDTILGVEDTSHNRYFLAVGPTVTAPPTPSVTQAMYYAAGIAGASPSSNIVTVTFAAAPTTPDVRILEYTGIVTSDPVDATGANSASASDTDVSVDVTTTTPDLIVAATTGSTGCTTIVGSYRVRVIDNLSNSAQDTDAITPGVYTTGCVPVSEQESVAQAVAFRTDPSSSRPDIILRQTAEDETSTGDDRIYSDMLAGDTVVVFVSWENPAVTVTGVHDGAENTYVAIPSFPVLWSAGQTKFAAYYAANIAAMPAGDSIVIAFSAEVGSFIGVYAVELEGLSKTNPYDTSHATVCTDTTSCDSGAVSTSFVPEVVLSLLVCTNEPAPPTPGPGYDLVYLNSSTSGMVGGSLLQFSVNTTPGSYETSFTATTAEDWVQAIFALH